MMTGDRRTRWVGAAVLGLAITGCGTSGPERAGAPPPGRTAGATSASRSASTSAPTHGAAETPGRHRSHATAASQTPSAPVSSPPLPSAGQTGGAGPSSSPGQEILPETPGSSPGGLPGLSPAPDPHIPLVSMPLPQSAIAHGRMVSGYPDRIVPAAPRSRIMVTSVASSGTHLQSSLTADTRLSTSRLELFYRVRLGRLGLREVSTPASPRTIALAFSRGDSHVVLTIRRGPVTGYSLFSGFVAAS
jgi:hypothetical protein